MLIWDRAFGALGCAGSIIASPRECVLHASCSYLNSSSFSLLNASDAVWSVMCSLRGCFCLRHRRYDPMTVPSTQVFSAPECLNAVVDVFLENRVHGFGSVGDNKTTLQLPSSSGVDGLALTFDIEVCGLCVALLVSDIHELLAGMIGKGGPSLLLVITAMLSSFTLHCCEHHLCSVSFSMVLRPHSSDS